MLIKEFNFSEERDTQVFAEKLAAMLINSPAKLLLYLIGDLGAGKTTLTRYLLQAMGVEGRVKSPTYTLIEPYETSAGLLLHLDLYRLADPEELEYLGFDEQLAEAKLCCVEWPSKGLGYLPNADLQLELQLKPQGVRHLQITAYSDDAKRILHDIL